MKDDTISRAAAIDAICEDGTQRERQGQYSMTMVDRKYRDIEILEALPSTQPTCTVFVPVDDCISRQAAIDMLKNRWKKTRNYEGIGDDIAEECELYLKQVPSAQPGWIPCSERCPEYRIYVLVTYKPVYGLPDIGITYYNGNKWDAPKDGTPRKVIAWMPLPKPYREGGQE